MPRKRDLDQMIETMKGVRAPATFAPTLSPRRRSRRSAWRAPGLALAAALGVSAGVVFLRPAPAEARGWASVQSATREARLVHERTYDGGHLRTERWIAPGGLASLSYSDAGKVLGEDRSDRRRTYSFFDFIGTRGSVNVAANARAQGTVEAVRARRGGDFESLDDRIARILKEGEGERMAKPPTPEGTWYRVTVGFPGSKRGMSLPFVVGVGKDGRVAEVRSGYGTSLRTVYDYPVTIPPATFAPRPQARIVPVVDLDAIRREIPRRIAARPETRRGIALRLAILDKEGTLFVFWTGPGIGTSGGDVRLPGVKAALAKGLWSYLAQYKSPAKRGNAPGLGSPLPGRAIVPLEKIGDRITVAIPGAGGEAVFRNVPVLRVDDIRYLRGLLGYGE